jgi:hypothetical protein
MKPASFQILHDDVHTAEIAGIKDSVIKTLAWFELFQYPLTVGEIRIFLDRKTNEINLHESITQLLKEQRIFVCDGLFSLVDNPLLAIRRRKGNQRAEKLIKKAERIGRFLFMFPFVRAVGVSGSLSKNFAEERADIDFFIITKSNRLWTARTFMHLYKKLTFITGRQHYYCMNYYVDEEAMFFEEQNIFTAIEIKTLLPVSGRETMEDFFEKNSWTDEWFPAFINKNQNRKNPFTPFKQIFEWLLNGNLGCSVERYLLQVTKKRWSKKHAQGKLNIKGQPMDFVSGKHYAMSNPGNFREKILSMYRQKLLEHRAGTTVLPMRAVIQK